MELQVTNDILLLSHPEMEFLDIKLIKDPSFLLPAIHSLFYWRILKKTILFSGSKNPYKKSALTRKLKSIHEKYFVERKNKGKNPDKNSSLTRNFDKKCCSRIPFLYMYRYGIFKLR